MQKITIAFITVFTCLGGFLFSDGMSELDQGLIAGKGIFLPDDGSGAEGALPESELSSPAATKNAATSPTSSPRAKPPTNIPTPKTGKGGPFPTDDINEE
jgi:hypothetical protein